MIEAPFQRHSSPNTIVSENGFMLREIIEQALQSSIVIGLNGVKKFSSRAF